MTQDVEGRSEHLATGTTTQYIPVVNEMQSIVSHLHCVPALLCVPSVFLQFDATSCRGSISRMNVQKRNFKKLGAGDELQLQRRVEAGNICVVEKCVKVEGQ